MNIPGAYVRDVARMHVRVIDNDATVGSRFPAADAANPDLHRNGGLMKASGQAEDATYLFALKGCIGHSRGSLWND